MKTIDILSFLLLAGSLGLAIAGSSNLRFRAQRVPSHLQLLGFINTTEAMVEKFDQDMCTKNGGPSAHDNHKKMWVQSQLCVFMVYQDVSFAMDENRSRNISRNERIESGWEKICQRVPRFEHCVRNLTESLKICLDPEKHENANRIYTTIDSVMKFLCEDNAARLKDLMNYTDDFTSQCLRSKRDAFEQCANSTIINYIKSTVSDGASIGGIGAVHLLEPDLDKCTVLEQFQHCSVRALNDCEVSKPAELANSIINVVKKATTCDHFLKSQAAAISLANLILLLSTVMAFYLRLA